MTTAKVGTDRQLELYDRVMRLRDFSVKRRQELEDLIKSPVFLREKVLCLKREVEAAGAAFVAAARELNAMCDVKRYAYLNIVPTVARAMLANNLTDVSPDNVPRIKYAEVGTGTNAPANGNTALQTSSVRNTIASTNNVSNVAYATAFFGLSEVTGMLKEAGIFADGSATQGTGVLVSRVAIDVDKDSSETLTIDWSFTIT